MFSCSALRLVEFVNNQTAAQLWLEPCGFRHHEFSLYLCGKWYALEAKDGSFDEEDPIGVLDVDISSRLILDKILGIKDLRSSDRIDFVGGLRGLDELRRRVDSGDVAPCEYHEIVFHQIKVGLEHFFFQFF